MLFSEIMKQEMKKYHLSIDDVSEICNLSVNKIRAYTLGTIPKGKDLEKVCKGLDLNLDDLVFDELNISISEASKLMQKSPNFVKMMVRKGVFGFYDGSTYHIPRLKFEQYMGMRDNYQIDNGVEAMFQLLMEKVKKEKADFSQKSANIN